MTPQERYANDPQFRSLVDLLTMQIVECRYTPTELREAAILAAIRYETVHARPEFLITGRDMRRVDSYHGREGEERGGQTNESRDESHPLHGHP